MKLPAIVLFAALGAASNGLFPQAHAADAPARNPPLVQPGAWVVTPTSDTGATLSYRLCFRTGALDDLRLLLPNLAAAPSCPPAQLESAPERLTWSLACPALALQADAHYRLAATRVEGEFTITQGDPPSRKSQGILARFDGPCP
jgi:hypothetical protein